MRPVTVEHVVSQYFASMATQGVVGNINAPTDTPEYWVGRYGNYQPFGHAGMDFSCPVGTRVYAMADGVVLYAGWGYNLPGAGPVRRWLLYKDFPGIVSVIQHPGWIGVYAHLSDNDAAPAGTRVTTGQLIGLSGNTGGVDPHLHVEALVDLTYRTGGGLIYGRTDPSQFFSGGMAAMAGTITPASQEDDDMSAAGEEEIKGNLQKVVPEVLGLKEFVAGMNEKLDELVGTSRKTFWNSEESKIRLQSGAPAQIAMQINAAGVAADVRDELVKLLGGK